MNNLQFRDLIRSDTSTSPASQNGGSSSFVPRPLGSRARSSVHMTPRTVTGQNSSKDFERQVAEHTRQSNGEPAMKRFKSAAAPKGTKLAKGYQDRAKLREDSYNEETSKEKKLKDLEQMLKDEKINQATFERLREQMGIGGDLSTTHLVKGLDRKLLERMREGEDVNSAPPKEDIEPPPDLEVDNELDNVLDNDVEGRVLDRAIAQEGQPATEAQSMSREELLRRLKESRNSKAAPAIVSHVALSDKFRKVPAAEKSGKKKFVETINGRGREVLLIHKKDGTTKRKTRWLDLESASNNENAMPLGMEVPAEFAAKHKALLEQQAAEDEDDDIFAGATNYNPLQDLDTESEGDVEGAVTEKKIVDRPVENKPGGNARNYFSTKDESTPNEAKFNSIKDDPKLMATLKRAAALRKSEGDVEVGQETGSALLEPEQADKHRKFLARLKKQEREDARDMDLGFGESRFGDEDDEDAPIYEGEEEHDEKSKRKRGPKKRKGNKDSVADVMGVLEGRKK